MTIFVDDRERASGIPDQLMKLGDEVIVSTLKIGDYLIGDLAIERKSAGDYISSLMSGHLHTQLYELSTNFAVSILLVEGSVTEALLERKLNRSLYFSSLAGDLYKRSPDGKQGVINVICCDTMYDSALFVHYLHQKVSAGESRLPEMQKKQFSSRERAVGVLASLPGIGFVKGTNMLNHFKSLLCAFNASEEELAQVDGIGNTLASRIYEFLRMEHNSDGE